MEVDVANLFGDQEAESVGGSDGESEREELHPNAEGEENAEQMEAGGEEAAGEAATGDKAAEIIKPKRNVAPQPKLDAHRLAGPRGMFALIKIFRNFKFKGKGNEREDLKELLKVMEHWAHRLYPKLPFKDTLEQIERLGLKKNVQVNLKKLRMDMFVVEGQEEDDNVKRGPQEDESETTPIVDVFDELLGTTPAVPTTTTTVPGQTDLLPASQPSRPQLTDEQRERIERNKRQAIEKRLARLKERQEQERMSTQEKIPTSQDMDYFDNLQGTGIVLGSQARETSDDTEPMDGVPDNLQGIGRILGSQARETSDDTEPMDSVAESLEPPEDKRETHEDSLNPMLEGDMTDKIDDTERTETQNGVNEMKDAEKETETQNDVIEIKDTEEGIETQNDVREMKDAERVTEKQNSDCEQLEKAKKETETQEASHDKEVMDGSAEKLKDLEGEKEVHESPDDTELMDDDSNNIQGEKDKRYTQETPGDTEELMDDILDKL